MALHEDTVPQVATSDRRGGMQHAITHRQRARRRQQRAALRLATKHGAKVTTTMMMLCNNGGNNRCSVSCLLCTGLALKFIIFTICTTDDWQEGERAGWKRGESAGFGCIYLFSVKCELWLWTLNAIFACGACCQRPEARSGTTASVASVWRHV